MPFSQRETIRVNQRLGIQSTELTSCPGLLASLGGWSFSFSGSLSLALFLSVSIQAIPHSLTLPDQKPTANRSQYAKAKMSVQVSREVVVPWTTKA